MTIHEKVKVWLRAHGACWSGVSRVEGRTLLQMWRNADEGDRHHVARMAGFAVRGIGCPACRVAKRDKPPAKLVRAIRAFKP